MIFTVYILYSASLDQYYIGHPGDLLDRIFRHNNSGSYSAKKANDWELIYQEQFETRTEAYGRECEIK